MEGGPTTLEGLIAQETWSLIRPGTTGLTGSRLPVTEVGTPRETVDFSAIEFGADVSEMVQKGRSLWTVCSWGGCQGLGRHTHGEALGQSLVCPNQESGKNKRFLIQALRVIRKGR